MQAFAFECANVSPDPAVRTEGGLPDRDVHRSMARSLLHGLNFDIFYMRHIVARVQLEGIWDRSTSDAMHGP